MKKKMSDKLLIRLLRQQYQKESEKRQKLETALDELLFVRLMARVDELEGENDWI